jgi:cysteine dioxygenase
MSMGTAIKVVSIEGFVARLRELPESSFEGIDHVIDFLKFTPVAPETLRPYLTWDRQHYTRNLIDKTPVYELIAVCWEIGQVSSVHNHLDQNCWMAAPIGRLLVQNYRTHLQDLSTGRCKLEVSDIIEMNSGNSCAVDPTEPVHSVLYPRKFNQRAVSPTHLFTSF